MMPLHTSPLAQKPVGRRAGAYLAAGLAVSIAASAIPARAQTARDLRMGVSTPVSSLDPHFANSSGNKAIWFHFFDTLLGLDDTLSPAPRLAEEWRLVNDTTWEFKLRDGVTFSNGQPLTAEDVVASFARVPNVVASPATMTVYTRGIKSVSAIAGNRVRIETEQPDPALPRNLTEIAIIPAAYKEAPTAAFNSGEAVVGTGPFILTHYSAGETVTMRANPGHWGGARAWSNVEIRIIANDAARVAALLSGSLHLADSVPPELVERIEAQRGFRLVSGQRVRPVYLGLDVGREDSPFVSAVNASGKRTNPLLDRNVRQALSIAINRQAISDRIMQGSAEPAGQILAPGQFGASPNVAPPPYDPAQAKTLLAEAGYPRGFSITLHSSNNRLPNDTKVAQAIGQMWTQIGLDVKVEVLPFAAYLPRATRREFSVWLLNSAATTGEMGRALNSLILTYDPKIGQGGINRGRYSNPEVDRLALEGMRTMDEERRRRLLERASEVAMHDVAVIPLYHDSVTVAVVDTVDYAPRPDQFTLAISARPR